MIELGQKARGWRGAFHNKRKGKTGHIEICIRFRSWGKEWNRKEKVTDNESLKARLVNSMNSFKSREDLFYLFFDPWGEGGKLVGRPGSVKGTIRTERKVSYAPSIEVIGRRVEWGLGEKSPGLKKILHSTKSGETDQGLSDKIGRNIPVGERPRNRLRETNSGS